MFFAVTKTMFLGMKNYPCYIEITLEGSRITHPFFLKTSTSTPDKSVGSIGYIFFSLRFKKQTMENQLQM